MLADFGYTEPFAGAFFEPEEFDSPFPEIPTGTFTGIELGLLPASEEKVECLKALISGQPLINLNILINKVLPQIFFNFCFLRLGHPVPDFFI